MHSTPRLSLFVLLLSLFLALPVQADVTMDGVDDVATSGLALSQFITATTGTFMVWYTPLGAEPVGNCNAGNAQGLLNDADLRFRIVRRSLTQTCVGNDDGAEDSLFVAHTTGVPMHIVLVHTGGTILMYKDGVAVAGSPLASGNTTPLTPLVRLGGGTGSSPAQASFHSACTYDVALAQDEIVAMAGARRHIFGRTQPTACWTLGQCGDGASCHGVTFTDWSGNGRHLTGNHGANLSGLTGSPGTVLTYHRRMQ